MLEPDVEFATAPFLLQQSGSTVVVACRPLFVDMFMTIFTPTSIRLRLLPFVLLISANVAVMADWPTWQHDNRRTGTSAEEIDVSKLGHAWTWKSPAPPQTAWYGPAKWDAYAFHRNLPSMRSYDQVFHVAAVGDRIWFGSSADDTFYCLNAKDGGEHWTLTTDGPIRLSPAWSDNRIYFGCDDGYARCADAVTGELLWKFTPADTSRRILNNGRFVPLQPCRTGVVVQDGSAWFANAMLPWEDAWLCCLDAVSGTESSKQHFVKSLHGRTMEGAPALSSEFLVLPQGRVAPRLFDRKTGEDKGEMVKSGGGSVVVVSLDNNIIHGPATDSRKGGFRESSSESREVIAGLGKGNALVVDGTTSWMLTDTQIIASSMTERKVLWKQTTDCPCTMIKAGKVLFIGGDQKVVAHSAEDGSLLWSSPITGRAFGLAAANGRIIVSTDEGSIHCFATNAESAATAIPTAKDPEQSVREIRAEDDERLIGQWAFQTSATNGKTITGLTGAPLSIAEPPVFSPLNEYQALELDGAAQTVMVAPDFHRAIVPETQFTAAAWVRLDQLQEWGGIIGVIQDDGTDEHGWLLGYRKDRFSLAVAAKDGPGSLEYVTSSSAFQLEKWYHVAGTYDGQTMRLFVDGTLQSESRKQRGAIDYPDRAWFEIGAYHDKNEYFRVKGALHEVRLYNQALSSEEINKQFQSGQKRFPVPKTEATLPSGPWLVFNDPETATVRWSTETAQPTHLEFGSPALDQRIHDPTPKTEHEAILNGLHRQRTYQYRIGIPEESDITWTRTFECDTFFNYTTPAARRGRNHKTPPGKLAELLQSEGVAQRGLCLLLGDYRAEELQDCCNASECRFVLAVTDTATRDQLRIELRNRELYGNQITVHKVEDLTNLPFAGTCANVVIAKSINKDLLTEVERMLRPDGGVAFLVDAGFEPPDSFTGIPISEFEETYRKNRKQLSNSGDWSHLYGRPDNSAFAGENLGDVHSSDQLRVQWVGRPGPRYQADRSGRKPSPLATAGRLFLQGLNRIVAVDSYNGTVLWSVEIPGLERFNMPRDCSNWCADRDFLYVVVKQECWKISAVDGTVAERWPASQNRTTPFEWGYVATAKGHLYGSDVKPGAAWTSFWGGGDAGWYDARSGAVTHPICSDRLFSRSADTGELQWEYQRGVVLNSTVTIDDDTMYFLESRSQKVIESDERRVSDPALWKDLHLVAIDAATGSPKWEKKLDPMDPQVVCYLAQSDNQLIMVTSADEKYKITSFNDADARQQWTQSASWPGGKGDHGKAMMRPAIAGGRIFLRPHVLSAADGTMLPEQMPGGHGCGTYACTANSVIYRAATVTMWSPDSKSRSTWPRLRPDCWLSTIPAGGMLLSPEGGGGCSCGSWMETSLGFLPKVFDQRTAD